MSPVYMGEFDYNTSCPICLLEGAGCYVHLPSNGPAQGFTYQCRRCGRFALGDLDLENAFPRSLRPYLSAATRQHWENKQPLQLTPKEARDHAERHSNSTVSMKMDKLLRRVADVVKHPGGELCTLTFHLDYPLIDAVDGSEMQAYMDYLQGDQMVIQQGAGQGAGSYRPTKGGWLAVEPRLVLGGTPGRCFVAMWFHPSMREAYDFGFAPGIEDAGFKAFRIDDKYSNKGISDEIKAEVRMAQFVVADFTADEKGQRGGVYFEAGFAQGLGREVIWCCRTGQMENVHFDVKHFGHVVWDDPADLRIKLAKSIRANIIPRG